mmetsp:Transcript_42618/g.92870  ORF Transcript_42618/g.92870 Transcript_42618/m.92870 type:complete len:355 (-) Transcript_42618:17-1081(-)|eukprot:CAMPEP_0170620508 /NCGR_PEP_ID=MMETSP0224-20130122/28096_1 /TAXON_ID=285029 /ORGANISM="Togula jolla, Strain CCCM 725" /LENGTH=354 /DNA_ID=CAMNT_0010946687 /DNA_START=115 /DNA_END=1179 /DNA_ORIENTATION=+
MPGLTEVPRQRFGETAKFLPVAFVWSNIIALYVIYTIYHLLPLLQEATTYRQGLIQLVIFNVLSFGLALCYVLCILVHPGTIPDKDEDPSWEYLPSHKSTVSSEQATPTLQETKRSGDRRHCKWCGKYKPDRCHHCRVCRMCVLKMDHHCPWIYNCVGFRNHKYFFLLLLYSTVDCNLIIFSMFTTVQNAIDEKTPFMTMFTLLFGETLAMFLGLLVTTFFLFHIWLMLRAMTTVEFCEKSCKKVGYDSSVYDRGLYGNICIVLGDAPLLWFLPVSGPSGDGLVYISEDTPLNRDVEAGRRGRSPLAPAHARGLHYGGGTGSAPESVGLSDDDDSHATEDTAKEPLSARVDDTS